MFWGILKGVGALFVALSVASSPAAAQQAKTKITVYTALDADQLPSYKTAIEKAVPEADIEWVRDSTGVITARFLAEKNNPKADMLVSFAASSLLLFRKAGLLEAYQPAGADKLKPAFRSSDGTWTGQDAYLGVICYNTAEASKAGLTAPKSWQDLLDSKYRDKIVMPHPASSGTGYLTVAAWLQIMGEEAAWKFMDGLHQNIAVYTHSGSAPCVQAAKGERVVGISFDMRGATERGKGAPLEIISPTEGIGWEMEAIAIVKGTKQLAIAKKIADWAASKEASELYSKFYAVVSHPDVKNFPAGYPTDAEGRMAKVDLQKMADDRTRVLEEWSKRYEAKAAKK